MLPLNPNWNGPFSFHNAPSWALGSSKETWPAAKLFEINTTQCTRLNVTMVKFDLAMMVIACLEKSISKL